MVRQESAKLSFPGSNPGVTSKWAPPVFRQEGSKYGRLFLKGPGLQRPFSFGEIFDKCKNWGAIFAKHEPDFLIPSPICRFTRFRYLMPQYLMEANFMIRLDMLHPSKKTGSEWDAPCCAASILDAAKQTYFYLDMHSWYFEWKAFCLWERSCWKLRGKICTPLFGATGGSWSWNMIMARLRWDHIETYIEEGSVGQEGSRYSPERIAGSTEGWGGRPKLNPATLLGRYEFTTVWLNRSVP